jgi:bifunctional UDP-N-acetylglucosamine pyrophosphorylase/glucosamine-1-phosphate N-acetyltransferase
MLETVFLALQEAGVVDVCLVLHHLAPKIERFAGNGRQWQLNISYAHQQSLLGTADAVRSAANFINGSCYILAADYALPHNFIADLRDAYTAQSRPLFASLKKLSLAELSQKSSVRFGVDGRIVEIVEKPAPGQAPSDIGAAPFLIVPHGIGRFLTHLSPSIRGEYELTAVLNQMIKSGIPMSGLVQPEPPEWRLPEK